MNIYLPIIYYDYDMRLISSIGEITFLDADNEYNKLIWVNTANDGIYISGNTIAVDMDSHWVNVDYSLVEVLENQEIYIERLDSINPYFRQIIEQEKEIHAPEFDYSIGSQNYNQTVRIMVERTESISQLMLLQRIFDLSDELDILDIDVETVKEIVQKRIDKIQIDKILHEKKARVYTK